MPPDEGAIDVEVVSRHQMEPMVAIETGGAITFANDRFLEIIQLSRDDVMGAEIDLFDRIIGAGLDDIRAAVDRVMAGDATEARVEVSMSHPAGAPVPTHLPAEARVTPVREGDARLGVLVTFRRIDTRKQHERRLQRQNERLEEFAGVVSHDLRNPLNVAEGHLALAKEECDSEHLDSVGDALARMGTIIETTLTLARQGQYVGETEPVDLAETVTRCWSTVTTEDATLDIADDLTIVADEDRLRNLLENLIRNSVEHGGETVTVRVGALDDGGFFVEDDGPGIPEADRDRVFELGYSTTEEGSGYGLAIVRWIAEAHGWSVLVTEGTDGGARFEFTGVDLV